MEANILQTPNISGVEKVTSSKVSTKDIKNGKKIFDFTKIFNTTKNKKSLLEANKNNILNITNKELVDAKKHTDKDVTKEVLAGILLANANEKSSDTKIAEIKTTSTKDIGNRISRAQLGIKLANSNEILSKDEGLKIKELSSEKQKVATELIAGKELATKSKVKNNDDIFQKNKIRVKKHENNKDVFIGEGLNSDSQVQFSKTDVKGRNDLAFISSYGLKKVNKKNKDDEIQITNIDSKNMNFELKTKEGTEKVFAPNQSITYETVMEQIENGLKVNYNSQLKEMKIKLKPEELGEVEVKFKIENNIMKAEFVVQNQTVKEIIENKFNDLKENLLKQGIDAQEVNVYVSSDNQNNQNNQNNFRERYQFLANDNNTNTPIINDIHLNAVESTARLNNNITKNGVNIVV
ncbi:flagellar hook-length control protein FliK [Hypnocyclicus thermotrophus]|uniref:Flagellar hook-length control protein FliK n=1 Tax=Hypnocyclicus thermotrophus TaxID=1627895 RepID=A0AA46DXM7_9FUSO|nr:flagellar hook-length control protein FliK [Hypnocyclicus thermotrophus]TDT68547.1 flagellar hook-length control protein FliK [Hypnocyclicus thermotrophus]